MTRQLVMAKNLTSGMGVVFYRTADLMLRYELGQEDLLRSYGPFNSLRDAVEHFKIEYRKREAASRRSPEEQVLIDQFNEWSGDLQDMEGFTHDG
ncbi:hypothetical protein IA940_05630 [Listeria marthii]|uniref:hypothetical protein n=1 Tax=Listeria marthii TaxID=529731 RepID=UPI001886C7B6|nr:hypothetical protein [Listeria marthii]MBF2513938.1 hypothetical protein [Listeria marthii]MBF2519401.1 hypothetical protein [Listeria marthii]